MWQYYVHHYQVYQGATPSLPTSYCISYGEYKHVLCIVIPILRGYKRGAWSGSGHSIHIIHLYVVRSAQCSYSTVYCRPVHLVLHFNTENQSAININYNYNYNYDPPPPQIFDLQATTTTTRQSDARLGLSLSLVLLVIVMDDSDNFLLPGSGCLVRWLDLLVSIPNS